MPYWVPYWLWRLDEHYEHRETELKKTLPRRPSEYFRERCYVSVEADEHQGVWVASEIGDQSIVFSTDFPHEDSRYPHATGDIPESRLPRGDLPQNFVGQQREPYTDLIERDWGA